MTFNKDAAMKKILDNVVKLMFNVYFYVWYRFDIFNRPLKITRSDGSIIILENE